MTTKTKIKSTGKHSSYYDIILTDDVQHLVKSSSCVYLEDVIETTLGADNLYSDVAKVLFSAADHMRVNAWITKPDFVMLNAEQKFRAESKSKIQIDDVILSRLGNDFDFGTILKSLKRAYEDENGRGKDGADAVYNLNKVLYSICQIDKRSGGIKYFDDVVEQIKDDIQAKSKSTK